MFDKNGRSPSCTLARQVSPQDGSIISEDNLHTNDEETRLMARMKKFVGRIAYNLTGSHSMFSYPIDKHNHSKMSNFRNNKGTLRRKFMDAFNCIDVCNTVARNLVFTTPTYCGREVRSWLRHLDFEGAITLIVNLTLKKTIHTRDKSYGASVIYINKTVDQYVKSLRALLADINRFTENPEYVRMNEKWYHDHSLVDRLRNLLLDIYECIPDIKLVDDNNLPSPIPHHKYVYHPDVYMNDFPKNEFMEKLTRNKVEPPKIVVGSELNFIFNVISLLDSKNKYLTPQKIKQIVSTTLSSGLDQDEILTLIKSKLYQWRIKEDPYKMSLPNRMQWVVKMSWMVPYIDPKIFYYQFADTNRALAQFIQMIEGLRGKILDYTLRQIQYQKLSRAEQLNVNKARSLKFSECLSRPEIQSMILGGVPLCKVHDYVYDVYYSEIYGSLDSTHALSVKQEKDKTKRSISIQQSRKEKNLRNNEYLYEEQSAAFVFVSSSIYSLIYHFIMAMGVVFILLILSFTFLYYNFENVSTKIFSKIERIALPLIMRYLPGLSLQSVVYDRLKLKIIEIKSVVLILIYVFSNKLEMIGSEISNLAITRCDYIYKFCQDTTRIMRGTPLDTRIEYFYEGTQYYLSHAEWRSYCIARECNNDELAMAILKATVPHEQTSVMSKLSAFCNMFFGDVITKIFGIPEMSPIDVQKANAQFTYINHVSRSAQTYRTMAISIISFLSRVLFCYDPFNVEFSRYAIEVSNVCKVVKTLKEEDLQEPSIQLFTKLSDLNAKLDILYDNPRRLELMPYMLSDFIACKTKCYNYMTLVSIRTNSSQVRQEPISVLCTGPPKRGKTTVVNDMVKILCNYLYGHFVPTMAYAFNCHSEYHDGYFGQKVTTIDDLFCDADTDSRRLVASTLISMVNSNPCPLNVAECSSKGKLFWTSEWLFMTTNIANNGIKDVYWNVGLQDPSALDRRFHVCLHFENEFFGDIPNVQIRVDRNKYMPEFEGKLLNHAQVCKMLVQSKVIQTEQFRVSSSHRVDYDLNEIDVPGLNVDISHMKTVKSNEIVADVDKPKSLFDYDYWFPHKSEFMELPNPELVKRDEREVLITEHTVNSGDLPFMTSDNFMHHTWIAQFHHIWYVLSLYITTHVTWVMFGFVIFSLCCGAIGWYMLSFIPDTEIQSMEQKMPSINMSHIKKKICNSNIIHRKMQVNKFESQSSDLNVIQALRKMAMDSVMIVFRNKETNEFYSSHGFVGKSGILVTTAHCFHDVKSDKVEVRMFRYTGNPDAYDVRQFDITPSMIANGSLSFENEDIAYSRMENSVQLPSSMYSRLYSVNEAINLPIGTNLYVVSFDHTRSDKIRIRTVHFMDVVRDTTYGVNSTYILDYALRYTACDTKRGDSGSMVFIQDGNVLRLVGLHVAGGTQGTGLAVPIYREHIDHVISVFEGKKDDLHEQSGIVDLPLIADRAVSPGQEYYPPTRNTILRTPLYGCFGEVLQKPVNLKPFVNSNGESIDPMYKACLKLHQREKIVHPIHEDFDDWFLNMYGYKESPRVFTVEESLNSILNGSSSINRSSSAGYPYCLQGVKGKYGITELDIDDDSMKIICKPEFKDALSNYHEKLKRGEQIEVIYAMCLKGETRENAKVDAGKTRLFAICPAHFLILMRMYFLDFIDHIQSQCDSMPISVGINPHSLQWSKLYARLSKFDNVIAGDFTNYDGELAAGLIKVAVRVVNKWYNDGPTNARVRELLFEHIYNAHMIYGASIYIMRGGNPSGNPFTAVLNSLLLMAMIYTILTKEFGMSTRDFELAVYGDDNIITTNNPNVTISSMETHMLNYFDMKYTHWTKGTNIQVVDTLDNIRYLGRLFEGGTIKRAPLKIEVIHNSIYWIRKTSKSMYIPTMLSTIRSFAIEASHLTKQEFQDNIRQLLHYVRNVDVALYNAIRQTKSILTYEEYQNTKYEKSGISKVDTNFRCV